MGLQCALFLQEEEDFA